jgi:ribosome-associated protein
LKAGKLKELVIEALDDLKGREVICLKVAGITTITDYMVVATGTSTRHVKSLSEGVVKKAKDLDLAVAGVEGQKQADWMLVDLGDVIVHVMIDEARKSYDLESLWGMTPSTVK